MEIFGNKQKWTFSWSRFMMKVMSFSYRLEKRRKVGKITEIKGKWNEIPFNLLRVNLGQLHSQDLIHSTYLKLQKEIDLTMTSNVTCISTIKSSHLNFQMTKQIKMSRKKSALKLIKKISIIKLYIITLYYKDGNKFRNSWNSEISKGKLGSCSGLMTISRDEQRVFSQWSAWEISTWNLKCNK
jgi:hypothetical protein